jgi:hypothetical protein
MNNILYHKLAREYSIIANDRDFKLECETLMSTYEKICNKSLNSVLELFAGPAFHAQEFEKYNIFCNAIDNSIKMKEIAVKNGFKDKSYIIGTIPTILNKINRKFDMVIVPRYSIGFVSHSKLPIFFKYLKNLLNPKGIVFIESQNIKLITGELNKLKIKDRSAFYNNEKIVCKWPCGSLNWSAYEWKVKMPVTIEIYEHFQTNTNNPKIYKTFSYENIFQPNDFKRAINKKDFKIINSPQNLKKVFNQSKLILIQYIVT